MKEDIFYKQENQHSVEEIYSDFNVPLKIRKIKLLELFDLPIPDSIFIEKNQIDTLENKIKENFDNINLPLILRVACVPNKDSMPFFYIENLDEINNVKEDVMDLLQSDSSIKSFIIQEATPSDKVEDKISGRIVLEGVRMLPLERVVELYKGSRSTGILNNAESEDKKLLRFSKHAGRFMKPDQEKDADPNVSEGEIRSIFSNLNKYLEKMEMIKNIIAKSKNIHQDDLCISFEFSFRDGKMVFSDID